MATSVGVSVDRRVVLLEGRSGTASDRVETRRVGSIGITRFKDVVRVVTWHDEFTSHFVEGMLADGLGWRLSRSSNADSDTHDVVGNVVHPFLVEDVGTRDVGSDVTTDRVTFTCGTVRVELSTVVTGLDTNLGEITQSHDLNVEGRLDEVDGSQSSIRDDSGVVSSFCAVSNDDGLFIGNGEAVGRTESTPIIDRVDG